MYTKHEIDNETSIVKLKLMASDLGEEIAKINARQSVIFDYELSLERVSYISLAKRCAIRITDLEFKVRENNRNKVLEMHEQNRKQANERQEKNLEMQKWEKNQVMRYLKTNHPNVHSEVVNYLIQTRD